MATPQELLAEFDKQNPIPPYPYVDFLANRKRVITGGSVEEFQDIFRADCRVACYATKTGLETKTNKGWQILRYGNFDKFSAPGEEDPEEVVEIKKLCDVHINIRKGVEAQMNAQQKGIKAKLEAAEEKEAKRNVKE